MREYSLILEDLQTTLNKKGRGKKGFNSQSFFIDLLQELEQDYKTSISTRFLSNLLDNATLTNRQKTHKVNKIIKGLKKKKKHRPYKEIETVKYEVDIIEYGYKKNGKLSLKTDHKTVLKEFVCKKVENFNFILA